MAKDGPLARLDRSAPDEPNLSDLLDPVALEERLKEARARRAEALARRNAAPPEAALPQPAAGPLEAPVAPSPIPVLAADPRPVAPPRPRRAVRLWPAMLFFAGLGGGAVAVLGLQTLPARVADAPAPPAVATATTTPERTAPEPAPAPEPAAAEPAEAPEPAAPEPAAAPPSAVAAAPSGPAPTRDLPDAAVAAPVAFTPIEPSAPAGLGQPAPEPTPSAAATALPPPALEPPAPPLPPVAAAAALPARVFIHYPRSAASAAAEARDALLAGGVPQVDIVPVRLTIDQSNIRYYHDGDRDAAGALSTLIGATLPDGPPAARDFTDYPTPPAAGKVEVWLAGTSDSVARRAPPEPAPPEPAQMAPLVLRPALPAAPPASQAQAVERILIERTVERLLEQGRGRN
jgi:hypothetical protein